MLCPLCCVRAPKILLSSASSTPQLHVSRCVGPSSPYTLILILCRCDTYEPPRMLPDGTMTPLKPIPTNTRAACAEVMEKAKAEEPWFGIEQEYALLNAGTKWPLGWPKGGYPAPQVRAGVQSSLVGVRTAESVCSAWCCCCGWEWQHLGGGAC